MNLNGVEYWYIRNAQGDITGLFDENGTEGVKYTYDSWGKLVSTTGSLASTVGAKNPYRYRGYRYDTETGLYYLQSRYYNPEWGRFINADTIMGEVGLLLSHNMFSYCDNSPINREDSDGHFWGGIAAAIGAVISIPVEMVVLAAAATILTIGYVGYMGYDWYRRTHVTYADSIDFTSGSSKSKPKSRDNTKNKSKEMPVVDVKGRKKWRKKPLTEGYVEGKEELPSRDMIKKPILNEEGIQVGQMHRGQPEYRYNPDRTKTPTGRVYPDHYHLKGDDMHYLP